MSLMRMKNKVFKKSQKGEIPIGNILVIALLVIPLIFLLIKFKDKIMPKFDTEADKVIQEFGK